MNPNETRTLWISIGSAIFAVFLMYSYSQEKKAEYDKRFGTSKRVVVAKEDIGEMQTIDDTLLDVVERPVDFIEPGALNDPEDIVGQVAATPIKKGQQVSASQLLPPGRETGAANQVSPGKRAVSISVDDVRGVSKLLKPGDRIDLIAALDIGKGQNQRREVKTIMQDIVVLATGLRIVNTVPRIHEKDGKNVNIINFIGDTSFSTVTLEVSPKQAQDLVYINSTAPGSLFVSLRNPNDRLLKNLPGTTVNSVIGRSFKPRSKPTLRTPASVPSPAPAPKKARKKKKGPFVEL